MKSTMIFFIAMMIMAGCTIDLFAQATENTDAGAKIVSALSINETSPLHFGTMTIPAGAVNLTLSTQGVRSTTGGTITLLSQAPAATNASYHVLGYIGSTYAITLPANGVVKISNGTPAQDMNVNNFVARTASYPAGDGLVGKLDDLIGFDSFTVGATLLLVSAQAAGVYTGTFNVSVAYN